MCVDVHNVILLIILTLSVDLHKLSKSFVAFNSLDEQKVKSGNASESINFTQCLGGLRSTAGAVEGLGR